MTEKKISVNLKLVILAAVFFFAYFVPFGIARVSRAVGEALFMLSEYAREHILLCLVPAFFIAGAIDEERLKDENFFRIEDQGMVRTLTQNILYMFSMIGILVFINWAPSHLNK